MILLLDLLLILYALRLMWKSTDHNYGETLGLHLYSKKYYEDNTLIFLIEIYYLSLMYIQVFLGSIIIFFLPKTAQILFLIVTALPMIFYDAVERFVIKYKKELFRKHTRIIIED